jgi:CheY-like chemotaxis protein
MRDQRAILLIENDPVDQEAIRRCFKELNIANPLLIKPSAEEALSLLHERESSLPCLILLDLQMPGMGGIGFLNEVKEKKGDKFKKIPVVVLTTSQEEQDRTSTFEQGVAGYIVKPPTHNKLVEALRTLDLYWTLSELP